MKNWLPFVSRIKKLGPYRSSPFLAPQRLCTFPSNDTPQIWTVTTMWTQNGAKFSTSWVPYQNEVHSIIGSAQQIVSKLPNKRYINDSFWDGLWWVSVSHGHISLFLPSLHGAVSLLTSFPLSFILHFSQKLSQALFISRAAKWNWISSKTFLPVFGPANKLFSIKLANPLWAKPECLWVLVR